MSVTAELSSSETHSPSVGHGYTSASGGLCVVGVAVPVFHRFGGVSGFRSLFSPVLKPEGHHNSVLSTVFDAISLSILSEGLDKKLFQI